VGGAVVLVRGPGRVTIASLTRCCACSCIDGECQCTGCFTGPFCNETLTCGPNSHGCVIDIGLWREFGFLTGLCPPLQVCQWHLSLHGMLDGRHV
jgi:hypothetical protein